MKQVKKKSSHKNVSQIRPNGRGLNLSHNRHTGRRLPHSHTSYPVLALLLLLVGVLIANISHSASADSGSYQVTASYLGQPPASAATIDTPINGAHVTSTPISVTGSCPIDSYVTLTRNGVNSGSVICGPLGSYSLLTDLFSGDNGLIAHVFSKFNLAGPLSNQVTVTYNAPSVISSSKKNTPTSGSSSDSLPLPLLVKSDFKYVGHDVGQDASYQFEIVGGTAPYGVSINWGDDTVQTISLTSSGPFTVRHTYSTASQYQDSYKIVVTAGDANGQQSLFQLLAIMNKRPVVPPLSVSSNGKQPGESLGQRLYGSLKYIWPTYAVTVLMVASFWFGELREVKLLSIKRGMSHHN